MRRLQGRNGNPGGKAQLGSIWEVVSTLAQALTDARDQLVGLMSLNQGNGGANGGGGGGGGGGGNGYVRSYSPTAGAGVRNLHRNHAHGHVAFGNHSEFRQQMARSRGPRAHAMSSKEAGRCQHPLHCNPRPARRSPPKKRGMQFGVHLGGDNVVHIDSRKAGGGGMPVNISFSGTGCNKNKSACAGGGNSRSSSPESKRHCIGTQYAALLKEEAYQLRERRLAEGNKEKKPKWARC